MVHARFAIAGLLLAATVAGCGDDEKDASGAPAGYCDAAFASENAGEPEVDFETATPEEMTAAIKAFAADEIAPLVTKLREVAPDEIKADIEIGSAAVDEVAATGDFETAFGKPEVDEALDRIHAYDLKECGWEQVDVTGVDYAFEGVPDEIDAGKVSFEFKNSGAELHEMIIVRINDGVTETVEELLALPEEEALQKVTNVTQAFADVGAEEYAVVELAAGGYVMLCFIPEGTTGQETQGTGPPHVEKGMVTEFTVK